MKSNKIEIKCHFLLSFISLEIKLNQRKARLAELKMQQKALKESQQSEKKDLEIKLVRKKTRIRMQLMLLS